MSSVRSRLIRLAPITIAALVLAACGGTSAAAPGSAGGPTDVTIGAVSNGAAKETRLTVPVVDSIRAELPQAIRDSGTLTVGLGILPTGSAPLGFIGTDQTTATGSEPDLARLVAAVLGLEPKLDKATFQNMFVGIDSGRTDIAFSNVTDTEQRKLKYDFACYRQDNLGLAAPATSTWTFDGDYHVLAGKNGAVDKGTNQEKILLEWQAKLQAEGKTLGIQQYPDPNATYLALASGRIDAYFTPNPSVSYHVTQSANTPNPTRNAGTYSGAGSTLQGLICATSKKDSGLAKPVADAINYLIQNGQYKTWLDSWNLSTEAVPTSEINPPGLPITNS